ncbi:MAG: 2,3-bisphosphoglycerate-dependent phosphoglycerate mutase [Lentisphaeria bacterium]|jgi:2,3-bisphosphoglycerate-dependent phosphoglycerate mutase
MTEVYIALVRHGEYHQLDSAPSALQPFPLSVAGEQQAHACANILLTLAKALGVNIAPVIHCSVLLRAWQTARILCGELNRRAVKPAKFTLVETEQLVERSVGPLANLASNEIERIVANDPRHQNLPLNWKSDSGFCLPYAGAESLMQAGERVAAYITSVVERDSHIAPVGPPLLHVVIGHGAAMRHAAHHLGVLAFERIAQLSMHHASPVIIKYCEGGAWEHVDGNWKERSLNQGFAD